MNDLLIRAVDILGPAKMVPMVMMSNATVRVKGSNWIINLGMI